MVKDVCCFLFPVSSLFFQVLAEGLHREEHLSRGSPQFSTSSSTGCGETQAGSSSGEHDSIRRSSAHPLSSPLLQAPAHPPPTPCQTLRSYASPYALLTTPWRYMLSSECMQEEGVQYTCLLEYLVIHANDSFRSSLLANHHTLVRRVLPQTYHCLPGSIPVRLLLPQSVLHGTLNTVDLFYCTVMRVLQLSSLTEFRCRAGKSGTDPRLLCAREGDVNSMLPCQCRISEEI